MYAALLSLLLVAPPIASNSGPIDAPPSETFKHQILLVFVYPEGECDVSPTVYLIEQGKKEKIGSLLTATSGYSEAFVKVYNRDYEFATLKAFDRDGYRTAAFQSSRDDQGCFVKRKYILVKGKRTQADQQLFNADK